MARSQYEAIISWFEDPTSGRCYYLVDFADGGREEVPDEIAGVGPIKADSDSHAIAEAIAEHLQLDLLCVDHDKAWIHATLRQR